MFHKILSFAILQVLSLGLLACKPSADSHQMGLGVGKPFTSEGMLVLCLPSTETDVELEHLETFIATHEHRFTECLTASETQVSPDQVAVGLVGPVIRLVSKLKIFVHDFQGGKIVVSLTRPNGSTSQAVRSYSELKANPALQRLFKRYENNILTVKTILPVKSVKDKNFFYNVEDIPVELKMYRDRINFADFSKEKEGIDVLGLAVMVKGSYSVVDDVVANPKTNLKIALKARSEFREIVKTLPEGTVVYSLTAVGDKLGTKRIETYQSFGFGPLDNDVGIQCAIVKAGKLVPVEVRELSEYFRALKSAYK